jgi:uncharacterized protein YbbC (DUF1343 family)/CubicO group peptidase (beta-lactamase class C family)
VTDAPREAAMAPSLVPIDDARMAAVDALAAQAISDHKFPGAVVAVGRKDKLLFLKAYGQRMLEPDPEPMTLDTVFDLASLTKPVAAATSILALADAGRLALDESVKTYLPECAALGDATIRHLLTHVAGLPADTAVRDYEQGIDEALRRVCARPPKTSPGLALTYSDVGFILLGEVVHRVSGEPLDLFAKRAVFAPLGMVDTGFVRRERSVPSPWEDALRMRAAPTESRDGAWMRGEVHDPRAWALGGVAGHAGLFSTAKDLVLFAEAMLGHGERKGARILSAQAVRTMFARHDLPGAVRALGWDVRTPPKRAAEPHTAVAMAGAAAPASTALSPAAAPVFLPRSLSPRAVGHSGFTGTSLWIDPENDLFVIVLSNRVHPDGHGDSGPFAAAVRAYAAKAYGGADAGDPGCPGDAPDVPVLAGIDVLAASGFRALTGAKVGLLTNANATTKAGVRTIDALAAAPDLSLVAVFTPEHGLAVDREGPVADGVDEATGVPVRSLYTDPRERADANLDGIDTLVVDLQDVGVRFYTYAGTMRRAIRAAAARGVRVVVLDRPNPLGDTIDGPVRDLAVVHGMTIGELAEWFDAEDHAGAELTVVRARGLRRERTWDALDLPWRAPSPNLRTPEEAFLYPILGVLEATNVSVGRGTDEPFEVLGAPWIDGPRLAAALDGAVPGLAFTAVTFTPSIVPYKNETCHGVRVRLTGGALAHPVDAALVVADALAKLHAADWQIEKLERMLGTPAPAAALRAGTDMAAVTASWAPGLAAFRAKRAKYLLYPSCP